MASMLPFYSNDQFKSRLILHFSVKCVLEKNENKQKEVFQCDSPLVSREETHSKRQIPEEATIRLAGDKVELKDGKLIILFCTNRTKLRQASRVYFLSCVHFRETSIHSFFKCFFFKMGQPRPLFRLFLVFSNKHYNFYNNNM